MKIGIMSDSHDRIENVNLAIKKMQKLGCKELIHCGDLCSPFMIEELAKFKGKIHFVLGNVGDPSMTLEKTKEYNIHYDNEQLEFIIDKKKIAINHYPKNAQKLAEKQKYDIVFYGHNHKKDKKNIKTTLLVNPGEIMGLFHKPSFAIYDTIKNDVKFFGI